MLVDIKVESSSLGPRFARPPSALGELSLAVKAHAGPAWGVRFNFVLLQIVFSLTVVCLFVFNHLNLPLRDNWEILTREKTTSSLNDCFTSSTPACPPLASSRPCHRWSPVEGRVVPSFQFMTQEVC